MLDAIINFDTESLLWIQETLRFPFLNPVMIFITSIGNYAFVWIVISVSLVIPQKTRKIGIMSLVALLVSFLLNNLILKDVVGRIRPYEVISGLELLVNPATDLSFPSGHAGNSFAVAVVLFQKLPRKYGIPALVLASLIGISRLYIGIHYPTDVLAGAVIGTLIAIFIVKLFEYSTSTRSTSE